MIRLTITLTKNFRRELIDIEILKKSLASTLKSVSRFLLYSLRQETPFDTSRLQRGWTTVRQSDLIYRFVNPTPYGYVVDQGRFRGFGSGPKTTKGPVYPPMGRGVFSTQAPKGITYPYLDTDGPEATVLFEVFRSRFYKFYRRFSGK